MPKDKLTLGKLRSIRSDYNGYFRPMVPTTLLGLVKSKQGDSYQWDLEIVGGIPKLTLEFSPGNEPTILRNLEKESQK